MWCAACAAAAPPLPDCIPDVFRDLAHYVGTFEPLLFEEAREGVRKEWQEARNAGKGCCVGISRWAARVGWAGGVGCVRRRGDARVGCMTS